MSKAHKAVLDSLRQPRGAQTKGTQSSEVRDDLCRNDSQLCDAGTASQLCCPEQTAAQQLLEGPMPICTLSGHSPCVREFVATGRGPWKIAWVLSQSPEKTLGSADQAGRAVLVQHHLQAARVVWAPHTHPAPGPSLASQPNQQHRQTFADLQLHPNTPDHPPDFRRNFRSG